MNSTIRELIVEAQKAYNEQDAFRYKVKRINDEGNKVNGLEIEKNTLGWVKFTVDKPQYVSFNVSSTSSENSSSQYGQTIVKSYSPSSHSSSPYISTEIFFTSFWE